MSELEAYLCIQARKIENKTFSCYNQTLAIKNAPEATMAEVYLKSEADQVIADLEESHKMEVGQLPMEIVELKEKLNEAQTELELWRDGCIISEVHQKELDGKRHANYKRCLDMAKICENKLGTIVKPGWWDKWRKRWLELAKKIQGDEMMCEYCKDFKDNVFKSIMRNIPIDSSLFISSKCRRIIWRVNGFKEGTLFAYCEINFCPMCGRKLTEEK